MSFTPLTTQWVSSPAPLDASSTVPSLSSVPKMTTDRERRPKLRASCDACAASKVKCSKEHPICQRCSANGSQCIYGVSRKHGKPGRTRKRNADGTPFIKGSRQRPSPNGTEFGKFKLRPEPISLPLPEFDASSAWDSSWSSSTSLRSTPDFEFEMTPEPFPMTAEPMFMDAMGFPFMDDYLLPAAQFQTEPMQMIEPELTFRDPFAKKQSVQLELPDIQALKDYVGGESVNPVDCSYLETHDPFLSNSFTAAASPESPKGTSATQHVHNPLRVSISMPTSHCCYPLAYSTLESLRIIGSGNTEAYTDVELKSLDSVLTTTQLAVQSVLQLLNCPCSADPHLSMLYSSITAKILNWYQIAAGINPASAPLATAPSLSSGSSSPSSSAFSSPLATPSSEQSTFNIQIQPLSFGMYQFDEVEQERLRRSVVLRELKKCSQLVDALANWRGDGQSEQAEFLYDVLGAWLKSELYKTTCEVEGKRL
jgi:hypothetical protein